MMPPSLQRQADDARQVVLTALASGGVAVISGAGLSTGSGIPAYRDHEGAWRHPPPLRHQEFLASPAVRQRYWARSLIGWPRIANARPNGGHRALARLEAAGLISSVITQNVDGLHQRAGSQAVIELHGGLDQVICLGCDARYARALVQAWLENANPALATVVEGGGRAQSAPDGDVAGVAALDADFKVPACPACAGVLKPDVVFFGGSVPRQRVTLAMETVERASALLVVGSSLMVYSGFRFVEHAHHSGKSVFAVNQGLTRADGLLAAKIDADCESTLEQLSALLGAPQ